MLRPPFAALQKAAGSRHASDGRLIGHLVFVSGTISAPPAPVITAPARSVAVLNGWQRLEAEILVLRHQLNILQQRAPHRLHLSVPGRWRW